MKYLCIVGGTTRLKSRGAEISGFVFKSINGQYAPYIFVGKTVHRNAVINLTNKQGERNEY